MNAHNSIKTMDPINSDGFTLLEILIAIFIFSVVLTTIYTSYTGTFRVIDETESQAQIYRMVRIAMERMIEDLESIYVPKSKKNDQSEEEPIQLVQFVGEDQEIKGRHADTLRFISSAYLNLNGDDSTGKTEIAYYVKENEGGNDFILYRSERPMFEGEALLKEESDGFVLCEGLVSINFIYYEEEGTPLENWNSTIGKRKNTIPRLVSIFLELTNQLNPEKPLQFMTSVSPPAGRAQL